MGFNRFSVLVITRVTLLFATVTVLAFALSFRSYPVLCLLISIIVLVQTAELLGFVSRTNRELSRFLDSARHADFSQRLGKSGLGSGFDELGQAFNDILSRLEENGQQQEETLRYLKALIDHVPVPSLSLHADDSISLNNNAARRLFTNSPLTTKSDLAGYSPELPKRLDELQPGERDTVVFSIEGDERKFTVAVAQVSIGERIEKVISLQDIQPELDAAQLNAWQALVRVLTHEIMNSITPINSLSKTTVDLLASARERADKLETDRKTEALHDELADVFEAVSTIAHRSDSLTRFVESYRKLTRLPEPQRQIIALHGTLQQLVALLNEQAKDSNCQIKIDVSPANLQLEADPEMFEQVIINLLRNATQALATMENQKQTEKIIDVVASVKRNGQLVISVIDNGPGIREENLEQVFVPFFTTKREGSGVGLALTRQIMTAHRGSVAIRTPAAGGTEIRLTF